MHSNIQTLSAFFESSLIQKISPNVTIGKFLSTHVDINGNTVLHILCKNTAHLTQTEQIVRMILNFEGIDVNVVNKNKETPAHLACENKMHTILNLLIKQGTNIFAKNSHGKTVQDLMTKKRKTKQLVPKIRKKPKKK